MKRERKGLLRIIEAVIAILIITSAFLVILSRQQSFSEDDIYDRQREILNLIIKNDSLREKAFNEDIVGVEDFILQVAPSSWEFSVNVCQIGDVCPNTQSSNIDPETDVFAAEAIVTSPITSGSFGTKRLVFFVWFD